MNTEVVGNQAEFVEASEMAVGVVELHGFIGDDVNLEILALSLAFMKLLVTVLSMYFDQQCFRIVFAYLGLKPVVS